MRTYIAYICCIVLMFSIASAEYINIPNNGKITFLNYPNDEYSGLLLNRTVDTHFVQLKEARSGVVDSSLVNFAKELAIFLDESNDMDNLTQELIYADVSSTVLSYMVRQVTQDMVDISLLSDEGSISGLSLGIRPQDRIAFKVKLAESQEETRIKGYTYGFEFSVFPTKASKITFIHTDEDSVNKTGLKLNINF